MWYACLPQPEIEMRPIITGGGAGEGHLQNKQSLVPVVQELWNAWEIHILILASLFLQVFLFVFAGMRRRSSDWFLRSVLWLAYLSADSVAVFVLGHLAVRATEPGHELVAFWAPFVLLHLGGQDTITAFAKQDNELWVRHLLNLVLQVAVAGYVVAKASWPDARLRAAMVLMFLCGFFKYAERTVSLLRADPQALKRWGSNEILWQIKGLLWREKYRKDTRETLDLMFKGSSAGAPSELFFAADPILFDIISVDAPLNKEQNITAAAHGDLPGLLQGFRKSSKSSRHSAAYEYVGALLEHCYRRLYTKETFRVVCLQPIENLPFPFFKALVRTFLLSILFLMLLSTAIAASIALALFAAAVNDKEVGDRLHTSSSSRVDIAVTYALLIGAIALDVSAAAVFTFRHLSFYLACLANCIPQCPVHCTKQWSQELRQYNITNAFGMSSIEREFGRDVGTKPVTEDFTSVKEFILDTLLLSGIRKKWRIASSRGQLALSNWMLDRPHKHDQHCSADHLATTKMAALKTLEETIGSSADFPTSVLILHIATDICYQVGGGANSSDRDEAVVMRYKQMSTELSNYIMYLVFKCGVMLSTNSQIQHDKARDEIGKILSQPQKVHRGNHKGDDAAVMKLFNAVKDQQQQDSMGQIQIWHQESKEQQDPMNETNNQESEEQQDSIVEIDNQESTDIDDDNDTDDHIMKLKTNSKTLKSPVLPRAVEVAQELISIENEAESWELIAKVWAEMLYYIAARCGGGFHYEHLSRGGEFVTHVLVLMYCLGPFLPPP